MVPPPTEMVFQRWEQYYGVDEDAKGLYIAVHVSPVAAQHLLINYRINHKGKLLKKHKVAVYSGKADKVV